MAGRLRGVSVPPRTIHPRRTISDLWRVPAENASEPWVCPQVSWRTKRARGRFIRAKVYASPLRPESRREVLLAYPLRAAQGGGQSFQFGVVFHAGRRLHSTVDVDKLRAAAAH